MNDIRSIAKKSGLTIVARTGADHADKARAVLLHNALVDIGNIGHDDAVAEAVSMFKDLDYVENFDAVDAKSATRAAYQAYMQGIDAGRRKRLSGSRHIIQMNSHGTQLFVSSSYPDLNSLCLKIVSEDNPLIIQAIDDLIEAHKSFKE
jgi:hypothetical protein